MKRPHLVPADPPLVVTFGGQYEAGRAVQWLKELLALARAAKALRDKTNRCA